MITKEWLIDIQCMLKNLKRIKLWQKLNYSKMKQIIIKSRRKNQNKNTKLNNIRLKNKTKKMKNNQ